MQKETSSYQVFKKHSTTFFNASLYFPDTIKKDIFTLYHFVRTIDNFIDQVPQDSKGFFEFKKNYHEALAGNFNHCPIINGFIELSIKYNFEQSWTDLFFSSMEQDLSKTSYSTIDDVKTYMDGSAASIGLMMSQIMELPEESHQYARKFSYALQYINFIRDINEDSQLGRVYLPESELHKYGLSSITLAEAYQKPKAFSHFINAQVRQYFRWQHEGKKGFKYFPKKTLVPIKTALDLSNWTAKYIAKNPFAVFNKKVKPSKFRIYKTILLNKCYYLI
jgi:15-cis-phytoene synthase